MILGIKVVQNYLREKIIFTCVLGFVFLYCPVVFAGQPYSFQLEKEKTVIFSYRRDAQKEALLNPQKIKINFEGTGIELSQNMFLKNFTLEVKDPYTATGKLTISYGSTRNEILISVSEKLKVKDFDIYPLLSYTRLQTKPLTCESSATADIVSYLLKKDVTEKEVFDVLPKSSYYNKLPQRVDGKLIWGNPNEGFVGHETYYGKNKKNLLPSQSKMTGYGVYEMPIFRLLSDKYGLSSKVINRFSYTESYTESSHLYEILSELENGNMVLLWGDRCTRSQYEDGKEKSKFTVLEDKKRRINNAKNFCEDVEKPRNLKWYYYDGDALTFHSGLSGEHTFYLLGYYGTRENPQKIYVWDTNTGYHSYALEEWMRKWNALDNRSLIVYKKEN